MSDKTTPPDCAEYAELIAQTVFPGKANGEQRNELRVLLIAFANEISRRTLED